MVKFSSVNIEELDIQRRKGALHPEFFTDVAAQVEKMKPGTVLRMDDITPYKNVQTVKKGVRAMLIEQESPVTITSRAGVLYLVYPEEEDEE